MKKVFYITQSYAGHFKDLKVKQGILNEIKNYSNNIFFDNEDDANRFLDNLKSHILKEYKRAIDEGWFSKER